ncbi:MAG: PaaI family thioesterase [Roseiarcus sp.]
MNDRAWRNGEGAAPALDFATLAAMVKDCPFHRWLGVELISLDETGIAIRTPWRAEFVSDPDRGYAHGGVLASLIDLAADYAVAARIGRGAPTVDMRVDYHRAAMPGRLIARAAVVKLGGTLTTAEARVFDERDELVASGRALFFTRAPLEKRESGA